MLTLQTLLSLSDSSLLAFEKQPAPITATAFNKTGQIFAYAIAYDWSKVSHTALKLFGEGHYLTNHQGYTGMQAGHPNKILLHACKDDEVKRKPRK